jgi:hypothetical protein
MMTSLRSFAIGTFPLVTPKERNNFFSLRQLKMGKTARFLSGQG